MKKFLASLAVLGLITTVYAQDNKVLNSYLVSEYDNFEDEIVSNVILLQDQFIKENGRYWQGLETMKDHISKNHNYRIKPANETKDWIDFLGKVPKNSNNFSIRSDVYESLVGMGYVLTITAIDTDGVTYKKAINYGDEDYREFDWKIIPTMNDEY